MSGICEETHQTNASRTNDGCDSSRGGCGNKGKAAWASNGDEVATNSGENLPLAINVGGIGSASCAGGCCGELGSEPLGKHTRGSSNT